MIKWAYLPHATVNCFCNDMKGEKGQFSFFFLKRVNFIRLKGRAAASHTMEANIFPYFCSFSFSAKNGIQLNVNCHRRGRRRWQPRAQRTPGKGRRSTEGDLLSWKMTVWACSVAQISPHRRWASKGPSAAQESNLHSLNEEKCFLCAVLGTRSLTRKYLRTK